MAPANGAGQQTKPATGTTVEGKPAKKRDPKWTVMVFMGADFIEGNVDLDQSATDDLDEIKSIGASETLEIFVQIHRRGGVVNRHRFWMDRGVRKVTEDPPTIEEPSERTLIEFIDTSLKAADHSRDDYSLLVLWGHAYDFAFGRSRSRTGVIDGIDFIELRGLLQRLQDVVHDRYRRRYGDVDTTRPTLDILAFDACDAATVELACQLQEFATYLLGSEIGIPIPGWPYDRVLRRLAKPLGVLMTPPEFGTWAVRRFCEAYPADSPVSLTLLDLQQATELRSSVELLALALAVAIGDRATRNHVADMFKRSQTGQDRPYVDVADLCLNLMRESADPMVVDTARALGNLLLNPRTPVVGKSATGAARPFVVEHGRNAGELARLNGVSLYAPHVCDDDFNAVRSVYDRFVFAEDTVWSDLVHILATEP